MTDPAVTPVIVVRPGTPARLLSILVPVAAIALVVLRAATTGLSSGPDDPASPWIVEVVTVALGFWLGWRATRQVAELRPDELRCRNVAASYAVDWDRVESLVVLRRGPVTVLDLRVRGLRRRLRVGAATRISAEEAEAVLDMFRAHPVAGGLLELGNDR